MAAIISEELLVKRTLIIVGTCDGRTQQEICAALTHLNALSYEDITLHIDSFGGGVYSGMHLYDVISSSKACIKGFAVGRAESAAFVALQACQRRIASPNANLMYHAPALAGLRLDQPDLQERLEDYGRFHECILASMVKRGRTPLETLREWSRQERELTAREALEAGLIDEIGMP